MLRKILPIFLQIILWLGFLLLPFLARSAMPIPGHQTLQEIYAILLFNLSLIGFCYFNILFLIPYYLLKRKFITYLGIVMMSLLTIILFFYLLTSNIPFPVPPGMKQQDLPPFQLIWAASSFLFFWVFSTGYTITKEWLRVERRSQDIENEKLKTELSYLQAQINPHFLFNTLNTIYTLAQAKSDSTADAVFKLSQMMRYVLSDSKDDKVPLEKELQYIEHYISLQRLRLTDNVEIFYKITGNPDGKRIVPLLLIPFVENVFKHGASTHLQSALFIELCINDNLLKFKTQNRRLRAMNDWEKGTGLGVQNVRRRLELRYPNQHRLELQEGEVFFIVNLELQLI